MQAEMIVAEALVVRLNAMNRNKCLDALTMLPRGESGASLIVMFHGKGEERLFQEEDAALAHQLANLPASGRLPIAFVDGQLRGADLAVALFCPWIILSAGASLGSGFGRPGSSAVYVAAARRLGTVTCERLLFRSKILSATEAMQAHLATLADNVKGAEAVAAARRSTLLCVAKANLVTWPMTRQAMLELVDPLDVAVKQPV